MPNNIPRNTPIVPPASISTAGNTSTSTRPHRTGTAEQTPGMSGKAKKKLAAAVNSLKAISADERSHLGLKAPLYQSIHAGSSTDAKVARQEFDTLAGARLENIRELIKLNGERKKRLDAAIEQVRSLLNNSSGDVRKNGLAVLGGAMREAKKLQREISLHQALLQIKGWAGGVVSARTSILSGGDSVDTASKSKVQDDWGTRIIEMLKEIPGDYPLGFRFSGAQRAHVLLWIMLDKQSTVQDLRTCSLSFQQ